MWNGWFDQVFPPTPSESEDEEPEYQPDEPVSPTREEKEKEKKRYGSVFSDQQIEPILKNFVNLTVIASMHKHVPVFLCKYRKDSLSSYISDALSEIEPLDDSEQNIELHQVNTYQILYLIYYGSSDYYIVHNMVC